MKKKQEVTVAGCLFPNAVGGSVKTIKKQLGCIQTDLFDLALLSESLDDQDHPEELEAYHAYLRKHVNDISEAYLLACKAYATSGAIKKKEEYIKNLDEWKVKKLEPSFHTYRKLIHDLHTRSTKLSNWISEMGKETPDEVWEAVWRYVNDNERNISNLYTLTKKVLGLEDEINNTKVKTMKEKKEVTVAPTLDFIYGINEEFQTLRLYGSMIISLLTQLQSHVPPDLMDAINVYIATNLKDANHIYTQLREIYKKLNDKE